MTAFRRPPGSSRSHGEVWGQGQLQGMESISRPEGVIVGLAVDHRDALLRSYERRGQMPPSSDVMREMKLRVVRTLGPAASCVLLDAETVTEAAGPDALLPSGVAVLTPLEQQGYGDSSTHRVTRMMEEWSPAKAAALGAVGCKLLLPFRVDLVEHAKAQEQVARQAADACRTAGMVLVLEPVVLQRPGERIGPATFGSLVVEAAARLATVGATLMKLQYPGSRDDCARLDAACGSTTPWVLLGGGAAYDVLHERVRETCSAGASGFIIGRSFFEEAMFHDEEQSELILSTQSRMLFERLTEIVVAEAQPWRERLEKAFSGRGL